MTVNKLSYPAKENAVQEKINEIIDNMAQKAQDEDITGVYNFKGQKRVKFTQSSSSDKLGFTLYNNSNVEKGYLEYNPTNTVDSVPLMTLGNYASASGGLTHVGFRKYSSVSGAAGAYNLLAPLISDARTPFSLTTTYTNFYLPLGFTDGTTTVTTAKSGLVNISPLLPSGSTVDQVYDSTSANAQSGVAIEGELSSNYQSKLVSGTNIKTINNTSLLGSGDIDTSEIFVATYGSTTFNEISNAINAGKYVFLLNSGTPTYLLPLISIDNVGGAEFYGYVGGGITYLRVCDTSDNWTSSSGTIGTVTSVNNVSPVSGNVTLSIPTVDQTYDSTSANAQSGVAINGAKFLQNTSTQSNSIVVGGTINNKNLAVCIGNNSTAYVYCTAIGASAKTTGNYQTVLGYNSKASGTYSTALGEGSYANGGNSTAIGASAETSAIGAVAIGNSTTASGSSATCIGGSSQATDTQAIALGNSAKATANSAIQLGYGTNSTANTLSIGFYNSSNTHYIWQLLDGTTGLIPDARISSNIAMADLSNLSATGKTVIDGQWVNASEAIISSATSLSGSTALTKRITLPNDNQFYEVLIRGSIYTSSTSGKEVFLKVKGNEDSYDRYIARCITRTSSSMVASGTTIVTASYVASDSTNLTIARDSSWGGNCSELTVVAYRRIGTNT